MMVRSFAASRAAALALSAALAVALSAAVAAPAGAHGSSSSGTNQAKALKTLAKKIKAEKKATYTATFEFKGTGTHKVESLTVAQEPPKSYYDATGVSYIETGTESLTCSPTTTDSSTSSSSTSSSSTSSSSSGTGTGTGTSTTTTSTTTTTTAPKAKIACYKTKGTQGSLGSLLDLFSPTTALDYFNTAEDSIGARLAGYSVKFSTASYGGLPSKCVTLKISGVAYKYCVAKIGLLTYSGTNKGYFELKSFSKNVPASDFTVPAGAKVTTLPS